MPKIIAHALTGASIIVAVNPKINLNNLSPVFIGVFLAISPDLDLLVEWLFNIPDFHRGFTHSLLFSLCIGIIISLYMNPRHEKATVAYFLAFFSHPLLDTLTSTSGGVKLLYPFSNRFYHFGFTNIFELPIGSNISELFAWIKIETMVFLPLLFVIILLRYLFNYFSSNVN